MDVFTQLLARGSTIVQPRTPPTVQVTTVEDCGSLQPSMFVMSVSTNVGPITAIRGVSQSEVIDVNGTFFLEGIQTGCALFTGNIQGSIGSSGELRFENLQVGADQKWVIQRQFSPPTELHYLKQITRVRLPVKLIAQGIQPPTRECRSLAYKVWEHLYKNYDRLPIRVAASADGGVSLVYENENGKTLTVEVYNDLEIAALVNQRTDILYSEDVDKLDFACPILAFDV